MGLIKAGIGALGSTLADQWQEIFYCEPISQVVVYTGIDRINYSIHSPIKYQEDMNYG